VKWIETGRGGALQCRDKVTRKHFYKGVNMEEYNWKGVKVVVECPECKGKNVEPVHPFDYVKQCQDCGHQFSTGVHN
jgi:hypothetical protein